MLAASVVLILVAVAGGTTWWMYTRDPVADPSQSLTRPSGTSCPPAALRVAAAPEIAPVVRDAATTIGPPRGGCPAVEVVAEEPFATVSGQRKPDVWIPSSSVWLGMSFGTAYETKGAPLARTPIVLAAPTVLKGVYAKGDKTSWAGLTTAAAEQRLPAVSMPDAERSTVGMLSVLAVNKAMEHTTADKGIAELKALTLRSRLTETGADAASMLAKVAGEWNASKVVDNFGVFPTTEQQLKAYQNAGHTVALAGAYPTDAVVEVDYPFAVARGTEHGDLAERLRSAIGRTQLTDAGFRTSAEKNAVAIPTDPRALLAKTRAWAGYRSLASQVLLLIDTSGSMNDKIKDASGRETTRAALLRASGQAASELFGDDTSIGMWYFGAAAPTSPAHREIVPFGPVTADISGKPRRDVLASAMEGYRAETTAGTPLYQSVLDATAEMQAKVKPGTATFIVVLTDGADGESRFAMTEGQFQDRLKAEIDPAAPVSIIAVGYGPDANMKALSNMASTTGGTAIPATNSADLASGIAKAFLAAHSGK
ncbi:VWA domain-containing protein [Actinoplanes sp. TBRC 11911]|uniref:VWA domain-containing protein n=1 Tax=Actinoplanes sp. TBRC 11911 TaxID=2729386 RepID=UPI002007190D|nr:VWA domain-containing protein [Actinoplanes sp. TBRC 11911]